MELLINPNQENSKRISDFKIFFSIYEIQVNNDQEKIRI